ncbi:MAG: rod shape-determining protein MreC [Deltaproteobacteria bacterium]|nr:rod shape-determining protein MreC [Deltaproteobacteria bacterium]
MFKLLARYRRGVFIAFLTSMPLMLLFAQTRHPAMRGPIVGLVVDVAGGIERLLLVATGWISDGLTTYVTSVADVDELSSLRRKEHFTLGLQAQLREVELENERLRKLANFASRLDGPRPLGAKIIGRSGAPLTRVARIDRGRIDGVRRGDAVTSSRGFVGRVLSTGATAADILLLTDPTSFIDVVVQRTREQGLVRGVGSDNAYRVQVEDFDRLADVKSGDVLLTSGLDEHVPPGIFVGLVTDVAERDDRLYQRAEVQPGAPLATVENVLVLIHRAPRREPRLGEEAPTVVDSDLVSVDGGTQEESEPASAALNIRKMSKKKSSNIVALPTKGLEKKLPAAAPNAPEKSLQPRKKNVSPEKANKKNLPGGKKSKEHTSRPVPDLSSNKTPTAPVLPSLKSTKKEKIGNTATSPAPGNAPSKSGTP